ncbi:MAG: cupin domain-containing protein [bacterium]
MTKRVFHKEEGEKLTLKGPDRTVYLIVEPATSDTKEFLMGIVEVPPGSSIPNHAHTGEEEIMFVYEGQGLATVDGAEYEASKGSIVLTPIGCEHGFTNNGKEKLSIAFFYSPPGIEKLLRQRAAAQQK